MSDNEQDYVPVAQAGEFSDESSSENQDEDRVSYLKLWWLFLFILPVCVHAVKDWSVIVYYTLMQ